MRHRIMELVGDDFVLAQRLLAIKDFSKKVRNSEYHITNACNLRCDGCWFFKNEIDGLTKDVRDVSAWREFVARQKAEGITSALLIGGEPTLYPERIAAFADQLPYVTISSNGLQPFSRVDFPNVAVALTLFGGGKLDDDLRGIKAGGQRITGLFDSALKNFRHDERAGFIFALTHRGIDMIEPTVKRIRDNGNRVTYNYYSEYGSVDALFRKRDGKRLLDEARRVKALYPETVMCHDYFIETIITGRSHWGADFGYDVCPAVSTSHPAHADRIMNGNPVLPRFNAWAPDLETVHFCCTSGDCGSCRDSQVVFSWLMVSLHHFLDSKTSLETWAALAESYWTQFVWSPFFKPNRRATPTADAGAAPASIGAA